MLHTGGVLTGVAPSPHWSSSSSRPLARCRQVASGDLRSPQGRHFNQLDITQDDMYSQVNRVYHHPEQDTYSGPYTSSPPQAAPSHLPRRAPVADDHDNTYVTMADYQTSFHRTFPALYDSLDSQPKQQHQQQQHHQQQQQYLSDMSSSSSSSSLENSQDAARPPNRKRKRAYVPHVQRKVEVVVKRNARERRRMGNLQGAFRTLQKHLPVVKHSCKRIPKEKLLRVATDYIRHLQVLLTHPDLLQGQDTLLIPQLSFLPQSPSASPASMTSPTSPSMTSATSPSMTSATSPSMPSPTSPTAHSMSMESITSPITSPTSSPGSTTSCLPPGTSPTSSTPSVMSPAPSPETMVASPAVSNALRADVKISHPYVMTPEGQDEAHLDLSPAVLELEEFAFLDKAEMKSLFTW